MEKDIERFIKENSVAFGGITLLNPENTQKLITMLALNNQKIHGIEGIFILAEGRRPSMDNSIDMERRHKNNVSPEQIKTELLKFVQERAHIKDLLFEVVF